MVAYLGSITLCVFICISQQAFVHSLGNDIKLIDKFLQFIWEPSALVRFWTALDQLYQIGSSYKEVAIKLITLPFRDPDQNRVHFNGKDRALGRIMDRPIPKHLDRIASTYRQTFVPSRRPQIHHKRKHVTIMPTNFYGSEWVHPPQSYKSPKKQIPNYPFHTEYRGVVNMVNSDLSDTYSSYPPEPQTLFQSNDALDTNPFYVNSMLTQHQVKLKMFLQLMSQLNPNTRPVRKEKSIVY